jgi:molybdate transport system substrate-binding protein
LLLLLWHQFLPAASSQLSAGPLVVAAAADLGPALRELGETFHKRTGQAISPVFGSSGNLATQIRNGAPFDLFLSADLNYARQLEVAHVAQPGSLYRYAIGKLVVWVPANSSPSLDGAGLRALLDPGIRRIAVANPQHAPYGRAAVAAMKSANVYDELAPRLVLGENVSQAAEFVSSGNAQAGFIPLSLALAPGLKGKGHYWLVPASLYPPIEQGAVIVKNSRRKPAAESFLQFLKSPESAAVLRRYGFEVPEAK